jgi:hypothetical protein
MMVPATISTLYLRNSGTWNGPTGLGLAVSHIDPSGQLFYQGGNHAFGGLNEVTHANFQNFLDPPVIGNFNVSSHYFFSQSGHGRPMGTKDAPSKTAILIGNNTRTGTGNAGRFNHNGAGTHVLAADGHVIWAKAQGTQDLLDRFNVVNSTTQDTAFANADSEL